MDSRITGDRNIKITTKSISIRPPERRRGLNQFYSSKTPRVILTQLQMINICSVLLGAYTKVQHILAFSKQTHFLNWSLDLLLPCLVKEQHSFMLAFDKTLNMCRELLAKFDNEADMIMSCNVRKRTFVGEGNMCTQRRFSSAEHLRSLIRIFTGCILYNQALRKHAHSNILKILPPKNKKNFRYFFFYIYIFFIFLLKPLRRGGSNEYPQSMFWAEIRKIMYTPVNPSFTI